MPARKKTAKKAPAKAAKKTTAAKAGASTAPAKQAPAKKAPAKKAPAKKAPAKKAPAKKAPAKTTSAEARPKAKAAAEFTSQNVNMGHVFSLRPRPNTSFRPGDFMTAKHRLKDESYASLAEAARAVVEQALELTHDSGSRVGNRRDRP